MIPKKQLHAKDLHHISMTTFMEHLSLDIQGYRCDTEMLFCVLTKAALDNGSLESACDDLADVADGNTLREQLNVTPDLTAAQHQQRYRDYSHVNAVIGATLDAVQDEVVEAHSRPMIVVDYAFGRLDEWMIQTLITRWRAEVWTQGVAYVTAPADHQLMLRQDYTTQAEQRSQAILGQRGLWGIVDLF